MSGSVKPACNIMGKMLKKTHEMRDPRQSIHHQLCLPVRGNTGMLEKGQWQATSIVPTLTKIKGDENNTVTESKYLGGIPTYTGGIKHEREQRISKYRQVSGALDPILRDLHNRFGAKRTKQQTIYVPVLTYGAETWTKTEGKRDRQTRREKQIYNNQMKNQNSQFFF